MRIRQSCNLQLHAMWGQMMGINSRVFSIRTESCLPLKNVLTRHVNGKSLRLKTYPDLAQLNTFLWTHGPQCNDCRPLCPATKEEFVLPTFTGAELLTLADWIAMSPVREVLRLFKHENDIGWDAGHLAANVLTHPIVHSLYLYAKKKLPNHYVRNLVSLYRSVFNVSDKSQTYYEPEAEAIQQPKRGCPGDFKFYCTEAKRVLFLNSFWEKLANIFLETCPFPQKVPCLKFPCSPPLAIALSYPAQAAVKPPAVPEIGGSQKLKFVYL